jgi:hypothetical protein
LGGIVFRLSADTRVLLGLALVLIASSASAFAGTLTVTPTTTLAAQNTNNTSAANTFTTQTDGNQGATNISKLPISSLLYSGATTKVYAHFMAWFGGTNHMNVGYDSTDPAQVRKQVSDALSRGISGFIEDWYGPNGSRENTTLIALKAEAEARGGAFEFAAMYDGGALSACSTTTGCDLTQQAIKDLTYAYNTFEQSPAYMRVSGRPLVFFFDPDRYATLNWSLIASSVPGNPMFIFQNSGGFTHASSSGSYAWVIINTTNASDWSQSYLDNFYKTGLTYPAELTFAGTYKGFNDTLAAWGKNRIMNQNCGQTWLSSFGEISKYFNSATQLDALQLVTWNDYEEGTELESGIDNCLTVSASVSGSVLSWALNGAGNANTVDHFTVWISTDGQNLMSVGDQAVATTSLDLSTLNLAPGQYTFYLQAIGKPTITNHMSGAVSFTQADPTQTPTPSPTPTPAPGLTLAASPSALTITRGQSGNVSVNVSPTGGFTGTVALACSNLPAGVACAFSPASVDGSSATSSALTIATATSLAMSQGDSETPWRSRAFGITSPAFALIGMVVLGRRRRKALIVTALLAIVASITLIGCGTAASDTTQASVTPATSHYNVVITATSGSLQQTAAITLTVN